MILDLDEHPGSKYNQTGSRKKVTACSGAPAKTSYGHCKLMYIKLTTYTTEYRYREWKGKRLPVVVLYPGAEGWRGDEAGGECTIHL
jgi:hypothetical protein